jgi:signal peptidase I
MLDVARPSPQCNPMTQPLPKPQMKTKVIKSESTEFFWFLLKLVVLMLTLRSFIFSPFNVPSESMVPRIMIGDYLIVSKGSYGISKYSLPFTLPLPEGRIFARSPRRGDVVVFKAPPTNEQDYIKRVIGLPGDLIEMRGGILSINGKIVPRTRIADFLEPLTPNSECIKSDVEQFRKAATDGSIVCRYPRYRETLPEGKSYEILDLGLSPGDNTQIFSVPEGHMFLMGDNRDRSGDSRFPAVYGGAIGIVPQDNLVGKAQGMFFSTDGTANWFLPWTWFSAARWSRIGEGF